MLLCSLRVGLSQKLWLARVRKADAQLRGKEFLQASAILYYSLLLVQQTELIMLKEHYPFTVSHFRNFDE